ncbi:MAG: FAD-dependent monooxygenase, partial [Muribaculaceae bacterium]|nr:FAD-dependent monooxygenase [Muribaculaceae bacterium]
MKEQLQLRLRPEIAYTPLRVAAEVSTRMGIDINSITHIEPIKRSIDARQRQVMVNLTIDVYIDEPPPKMPQPATHIDYQDVSGAVNEVIVVGAGPAGLFAALKLIEAGVRPIVLERGKDVDSRRKDLARISRENVVDPDSNYCFG